MAWDTNCAVWCRVVWRSVAAVALAALLSGCANQYAVLYVNSQPEIVKVWSGTDGQYLGQTPLTVQYTRTPFDTSNKFALVIFEKKNYQTTFKAVQIDKWASTWLDANINQNTVSANLTPIP
jgi:hypothetical protein